LDTAGKHGLCFKCSKYKFNASKIPILGFVVGNSQVQMEEEKIWAIKDWLVLRTVKISENS
jgi:hypothetical protein